jgi:hypothetical protein
MSDPAAPAAPRPASTMPASTGPASTGLDKTVLATVVDTPIGPLSLLARDGRRPSDHRGPGDHRSR